MGSIEWSRWMSVGIAELDDDHRRLVEIVNKLAVDENRNAPDVIEAILDELIHYTKDHFAREEEHMRRANYPTFAAHKALHDGLTRNVEAYRERFHAQRDTIPGDDVFEFCAGWLGKHILREDTHFGEYAAAPADAAVAAG